MGNPTRNGVPNLIISLLLLIFITSSKEEGVESQKPILYTSLNMAEGYLTGFSLYRHAPARYVQV